MRLRKVNDSHLGQVVRIAYWLLVLGIIYLGQGFIDDPDLDWLASAAVMVVALPLYLWVIKLLKAEGQNDGL